MNKIDPNVRFLDLAKLEADEKIKLQITVNQLESLASREDSIGLTEEQKQQLALCRLILEIVKDNNQVCEPLFVATRELLNNNSLVTPHLHTEQDGTLKFNGSDKNTGLGKQVTLVSLTLGILAVDGATPPPVKVMDKNNIVPDADHALMSTFTSQFYTALGEASSYGILAGQVLATLCIECDPDGRGNNAPGVKTTEFARVMRGLAKRKIMAGDYQLRRRVNEELNTIQNVGGLDGIADFGIDLPDLEDIQDANIVADNVRVMGTMIVAAMFDELKVFQVVDRIVEQFQHGTLPIGPGNAGTLLYKYWRETPNRISEQERKNFATMTLGVTGGDPNVAVNREFNDLWIRFVSAVSSFVRQTQVDALLRANIPNHINQQQVRKAARDLASNLSLHGFGMAHYAAGEIKSQVKFMIDLLQDQEIRGCYGAKDMWQVIDQVATYDLGGAKTSSRYRTLATCGTIITAWLANHVQEINRTAGPLLDIAQIKYPDTSKHKATLEPTDYDLVNACELWLADTATNELQIEQYAQSRLTPQMTSKPVPIPAMAREMLDGIGDLGGSLGSGAPIYGKAMGAPSFYSR